MTREEAREWLEEHIPTKIMPVAKRAYEIAIEALTPPTQEQVEKVWRESGLIIEKPPSACRSVCVNVSEVDL